MLFSRARNTAAGLLVTSALALGVATPVDAAPVSADDRTSQVATRTAPAATTKLASVKRKTKQIAATKTKKYKRVQAHLRNNADSIPGQIRTTALHQAKAGKARVKKLKRKALNANSVKRVKSLRGKINQQRPGDIKTIVMLATRATTAATAGDAGLLEEILDDLVGLDVADSVLGPVVTLVDGLLEAVLGGGDAGNPLGILDDLLGVLDSLLGGLLDGLLGGLLGGLL